MDKLTDVKLRAREGVVWAGGKLGGRPFCAGLYVEEGRGKLRARWHVLGGPWGRGERVRIAMALAKLQQKGKRQ